MGSPWVLPNEATERDGGDLSSMKLQVNGVFLGVAEGLTRAPSKEVRGMAGNRFPGMGDSQNTHESTHKRQLWF